MGFVFFRKKNKDIEIKHPSRGLRSPKIASVLHAFLFLFSLSVVIEMQKNVVATRVSLREIFLEVLEAGPRPKNWWHMTSSKTYDVE